MTKEEAIARLEAAGDIAFSTGCELAKIPVKHLYEIADFLKEQEQVEPIHKRGWLFCGNCTKRLYEEGEEDGAVFFCPNCGKKVKRLAAEEPPERDSGGAE